MVEDGDVEPGVVGAVAGCPDDGADVVSSQSDFEQGLGGQLSRLESVRWINVAATGAGSPLVEAVEEPVHFEVGEPAGVGKPSGELGDAVPDRAEPTDDLDAEMRRVFRSMDWWSVVPMSWGEGR